MSTVTESTVTLQNPPTRSCAAHTALETLLTRSANSTRVICVMFSLRTSDATVAKAMGASGVAVVVVGGVDAVEFGTVAGTDVDFGAVEPMVAGIVVDFRVTVDVDFGTVEPMVAGIVVDFRVTVDFGSGGVVVDADLVVVGTTKAVVTLGTDGEPTAHATVPQDESPLKQNPTGGCAHATHSPVPDTHPA